MIVFKLRAGTFLICSRTENCLEKAMHAKTHITPLMVKQSKHNDETAPVVAGQIEFTNKMAYLHRNKL